MINNFLAENNKQLVEYGIFYNINDLEFEQNNNKAIDKLIDNCVDLKRIYLLNKDKESYGSLLKKKILSIEVNKNNFQIVFCYGLDDIVIEDSRFEIGIQKIPPIKPPKLDFHSKFLN